MSSWTPRPAVAAVRAAFARIAEVDRPEVWITLRAQDEVEREAADIDARRAAGEDLALAGLIVAVKDNIDVAGLPTSIGLPLDSASMAVADAPAVARLRSRGGVVLGKTNLDQFATGLVGTRSPHGAVRGARLPDRISGGSSSGSAVAVALGEVDVALGTDTAGSGRVPAALNAIVGLKPTLGLVPTTGMRDAFRPYDTITVFAPGLHLAAEALAVMTGPDGVDPNARRPPAERRLAAPAAPIVLVPDETGLSPLSASARAVWDAACQRVSAFAELRPVDTGDLLAAARLLYGGAIVAGRYAAAGRWVDEPGQAGLDPTVASIVRGARRPSGWEYVRDVEQLDRARLAALDLLTGADALMLPTAPRHPSIAEVAADPIGVNAEMGTYTNFVNLLDLAAVAVPAGALGPEGAEGDFGVTFVVRPFEDAVALDLAARLTGSPDAGGPLADDAVELAVFGAHLRGLPLHHQLVEAGARFGGDVRTEPCYRLYALATEPAKPGLVRVADAGASVPGESWLLSPGALGRFLAALPAPMTLGTVTLSDGRPVVGFGCEQVVVPGARDITAYGGWRAYVATTAGQRAV